MSAKQFLVCLFLAASLTNIGLTFAKDMYKYQDESGQWIFTDKKPQNFSSEDIQVERMEFYSPSRIVTIKNNGPRKDPRLYAINDSAAPVEVEIRFTDPTYNVRLNGSMRRRTFRTVVPAQGEKFLVKIEPIESLKWRYNYRTRHAFGKPVNRSNWDTESSFAYKLPFDENASYSVSQGFGGRSTHSQPHSRYAVDISMPQGTPVLAARSGTVIALENHFFRGGKKVDLYNRSNFVKIYHDDNTTASYYHLDLDSVVVRLGQKVGIGELLGKSGTTGYSSGPHLHFVIQQNQGTKMVSIPFRFRGMSNRDIPRKGMYLGSNPTSSSSDVGKTGTVASTYMKKLFDVTRKAVDTFSE